MATGKCGKGLLPPTGTPRPAAQLGPGVGEVQPLPRGALGAHSSSPAAMLGCGGDPGETPAGSRIPPLPCSGLGQGHRPSQVPPNPRSAQVTGLLAPLPGFPQGSPGPSDAPQLAESVPKGTGVWVSKGLGGPGCYPSVLSTRGPVGKRQKASPGGGGRGWESQARPKVFHVQLPSAGSVPALLASVLGQGLGEGGQDLPVQGKPPETGVTGVWFPLKTGLHLPGLVWQ